MNRRRFAKSILGAAAGATLVGTGVAVTAAQPTETRLGVKTANGTALRSVAKLTGRQARARATQLA